MDVDAGAEGGVDGVVRFVVRKMMPWKYSSSRRKTVGSC